MEAHQEFIAKTRKLIELERSEEIEENRQIQETLSAKELQRRGVCLLKLQIKSTKTGLYGRTLVVLELARHFMNKKLPANSISPGDIVGLSYSQGDTTTDNIASGIVLNVKDSSVTIAFDESSENLSLSDDSLYKITKLANDITYKRIKRALDDLERCHSSPSQHLIDVLFGMTPSISTLQSPTSGQTIELTYFNSNLDDSQREAVSFALQQREIAVIHGPPGTGKTTTVVEIILQAVKQQMKVLACAPSNIAVDNLVERLGGHVKVVRLGHPARILPGIHQYSLDAILSRSDAARIVEDVRKDIDKTRDKMSKIKDKSEKFKLREDTRHLRKELKQRESKAIKEILQSVDVVLATNISASISGPLQHLKENHFNLVVIDECAQALEASCWIPLLQSPRCVLAGDHHQLPPTIMSNQACKDGLGVSLMERVVDLHGDKIVRMLTTQYRMHEDIMRWSSSQLYQDRLYAHQSVAHHLLKDLPGVADTEETNMSLLLIDTAGCDLYELELDEEMSKGNEGEADLVQVHIETLISAGVAASDIAVIAPYNLQVDLLRLRLSTQYPKLEIKTVDGFQGREKEAVIISMVRSNSKGEVGFLSEDRRMNVAVTRARRHLAIICDSETVSHHEFLKTLVDYMNEHGEVQTAFQYIEKGSVGAQRLQPEYLQRNTNKQTKPKSKRDVRPKETQPKAKTTGSRKDSQELSKQREEEIKSACFEESINHQIEDFICEIKDTELSFPNTLTSRQRFLVHEAAEKRGLHHYSQGEGTDRHIIISKTKIVKNHGTDHSHKLEQDEMPEHKVKELTENEKDIKDIQDMNNEETMSDNVTIVSNESSSKDNMFECSICKKWVPTDNRLLHEINCESKFKVNIPKTKPPDKKRGKKKKPIATNMEEEDLDKLLQDVMKTDNTCHFYGCKESTRTLGQTCQCCHKLYCFTHHMAEIHGCGNRAKHLARQQLHKQTSSSTKDKTSDPAKRANLQRKMDKKMNELSEKRRPKSGKKK
ncbi:DNA-binding protein SMUBP-2-like [Glandiceps talaboti]